MKNFLHKLWNYDFSKIKVSNLIWFWIIGGGLVGYIALKEEFIFSLIHLFDILLEIYPYEYMKYVYYVLLATLILYLVLLLIFHDRKASKEIGRDKLYGIIIPHMLVNVIDAVLLFIVVIVVGFICKQLFFIDINILELKSMEASFAPFQFIIDFYDKNIPTIVKMPYVVALFLTIILADLPTYIFHYACHWSRFMWLVMHRSHHSAEYLHNGGQGPVYGFIFLLFIPMFFVKLTISKFIYTEPLVVELIIFQIVLFVTEKFNHSSAFYDLANKNKVLSFIFRFLGNGPYHIQHHSAKEGEDIVNIANVFFNFWDRFFGTYKEPDKHHPPVGLTNQPKIKMNPFRLYFGGVMTILYELKHNSIKHWFKIIFGSVYYVPPNTKEYLIESYPKEVKHLVEIN